MGVLGRGNQEEHCEFKTSLGYIVEVSKCSRKGQVGAGETAQLGKYSVAKDESLGSIPREPAMKNWNRRCMLLSIALRKDLPYTPKIKNKKRGRCYMPCTGSL